VILYFHGGAYALGSARAGAGLAADHARPAGTRVISVDYRLAPENPFPAAIEDAVAAYRALLDQVPSSHIAIAGESAGGGLAAATLVALKEAGQGRGLPGRHRSGDAPGQPCLADLTGLPPLLIQGGAYEILLDDAVRLAARAAACDVEVTLQITPGVDIEERHGVPAGQQRGASGPAPPAPAGSPAPARAHNWVLHVPINRLFLLPARSCRTGGASVLLDREPATGYGMRVGARRAGCTQRVSSPRSAAGITKSSRTYFLGVPAGHRHPGCPARCPGSPGRYVASYCHGPAGVVSWAGDPVPCRCLRD
jgi:dienelactone hydrolase